MEQQSWICSVLLLLTVTNNCATLQKYNELTCVYYNQTSCDISQKNEECESALVKCEDGEFDTPSYCYAVYSYKQTKILNMGCSLNNNVKCNGEICEINEEIEPNGEKQCCCKGHLCNNEIRWYPKNENRKDNMKLEKRDIKLILMELFTRLSMVAVIVAVYYIFYRLDTLTQILHQIKMCTNTNQDQALLHEQQKLNTELLVPKEWTEQKMNKQMMLHDQMVSYYDRMLTKCNVYEEELERTRTENARFKFTAQCLMEKIKELTSIGVNKSSINSVINDEVNDNNEDEDLDKENDIDPIATYLEVCSKTLIDEVGAYKEQVEKATIELNSINEQLVKSAEMQVCLRRCVDELTVLAETERMKRDRDELELQTTVNQLTAEIAEVQQEMNRLQSVKAEISTKLMHRESEQDELDEVLRTDNARLQAQLGKSAIVEAALQSKIYDLELELSKRTGAAQMQQEQCQTGAGSESIDSSSTSMILYQCNLSRTSDDQETSFPDLGRGDDQLIPCLLSSIKSSTVATDVQLSCSKSTNNDCEPSSSKSTNNDCQPSCLKLTDDDQRPSCSTSTAQQDSAETASEPSLDELRNRRLAELIKQYESKHDDDS